MNTSPTEGLNPDQLEAVTTLRGPLCILAGAGSGKTTTITRRIAQQVLTGAFPAGEILAVTFTDKAAKEMVSRLGRLGADQVRARTFHAEALAQYRRYSPDPSDILGSKASVLVSLVKSLPTPYRFTSLRDIATEIEWAKNHRLTPATYESGVGDHETPIPIDLMTGVFISYEKRKIRARQIDFEDLLGQTSRTLEENPRALSEVRERYRAFTVDEYQDVNLLQQALLDTWAGESDELCVVGDDYQSIFRFTGASAEYLLGFSARFPGCKVVKLTTNYRSAPEILALANRLVPRLGGTEKSLQASRPSAPRPQIRSFPAGQDEVSFIVTTADRLHEEGVAWEEVAVLYRINGRSEDLEQALVKAHVPFQVKDSIFLRRPAARALMAKLRRVGGGSAAEVVLSLTDQLGFRTNGEATGDEATRQADLARFRSMALEFGGEVSAFLQELRQRFEQEASTDGIQILTYHRAKGLEFEAVFLPRLEEKELPFALSKSADDIAEERRLFYVGITRAKRHLLISWCAVRDGERRRFQKPSPFLEEISPGEATRPPSTSVTRPRREEIAESDRGLFDALKRWRRERSRRDGVPAFIVFPDRTLEGIAAARPTDTVSLMKVSGVGPKKVTDYGGEVLAIVRNQT